MVHIEKASWLAVLITGIISLSAAVIIYAVHDQRSDHEIAYAVVMKNCIKLQKMYYPIDIQCQKTTNVLTMDLGP